MLEQLRTDGPLAHVNWALGGYVQANDAGHWLQPIPFAVRVAAALAGEDPAATCVDDLCTGRATGGRWLLALRPHGARSVVAGLLWAAATPEPQRVSTWLQAIDDRFHARTGALLGRVLSNEEAGLYGEALRDLAAIGALDPDSPWARVYAVRVKVQAGRARQAYVDFRRLVQTPHLSRLAALSRFRQDPELAAFAAHSAVAPHLAALDTPPPTDPAGLLAYLMARRAAPHLLKPLIVQGGPDASGVAALLRVGALLAPDAIDDDAVRWGGWTLRWALAAGTRRITGLQRPAADRPR